MANIFDPKLNLSYGWALGENDWNTGMDTNLTLLGAVAYLSLVSQTTTTPPASPTDGDAYYVPIGATGEWAGHATEIAYRVTGSWLFTQTNAGWNWYVEDESDTQYTFDGVSPVLAYTITSAGGDESLVGTRTGNSILIKGLTEGTGISFTDNGTDISIAASSGFGNTSLAAYVAAAAISLTTTGGADLTLTTPSTADIVMVPSRDVIIQHTDSGKVKIQNTTGGGQGELQFFFESAGQIAAGKIEATTNAGLTIGAGTFTNFMTINNLGIDITCSGAADDITLTVETDAEVLLSLQTSAMNSGSPSDLAIATKLFVEETSSLTAPRVTTPIGTTTYTLLTTDIGKAFRFTNAAGCAVTFPSALGVGFHCTLIQTTADPAGDVTFIEGAGATLQVKNGDARIGVQYGEVSVLTSSGSGYIVFGDTST